MYFDEGVNIDTTGDVVIDEGCLFCRDVIISRHKHEFVDGKWLEIKATLPLHIERNVFIGDRAIILWHVTFIGERSTIGAGSVVTHNVPKGVTVLGVPASVKT